VALLRGAGFEDISIDLISGLPGARAPCAPRPLPAPSPVGLCAIMPVATIEPSAASRMSNPARGHRPRPSRQGTRSTPSGDPSPLRRTPYPPAHRVRPALSARRGAGRHGRVSSGPVAAAGADAGARGRGRRWPSHRRTFQSTISSSKRARRLARGTRVPRARRAGARCCLATRWQATCTARPPARSPTPALNTTRSCPAPARALRDETRRADQDPWSHCAVRIKD
jgi:hypothetical protein